MDVTMPDGTVIEDVPEGTTKTQLSTKYQAHLTGQSAANPVVDAIRSIPGSLAKGVAGVAGLPGDLKGLLDAGMNKLTGADVHTGGAPTSNDINSAISKPFGGYYEPQTMAGRVVDTVGQFAPAALAPGSAGVRAARMLLPGAGDAAAGEATRGKPYEGIARFAGAVAGAGALGGLRQAIATPKPPTLPTTSEIKSAATQAYGDAEKAGVIIPGNKMQELATSVKSAVVDAGIDKTLHPRAMAAVQRLLDAKDNTTLKGVDILRRVAGSAAASPDKDEARLAYIVLDHIDDFVQNLRPSDVVTGDPEAAAASLTTARRLWAQQAKSSTVDTLMERAKNRAETIGGSGIENAIRVEFRGLAQSPRRMAGFSPAQQTAIRDVARGGPISNALRTIGKLAPTNTVSALGEMGAMYADPKAIALPIAGATARIATTALTKNRAKVLSELIRRGGPAPAQPQVWQPELATGLLGRQEPQPNYPSPANNNALLVKLLSQR